MSGLTPASFPSILSQAILYLVHANMSLVLPAPVTGLQPYQSCTFLQEKAKDNSALDVPEEADVEVNEEEPQTSGINLCCPVLYTIYS
jgi:hypothetical protein